MKWINALIFVWAVSLTLLNCSSKCSPPERPVSVPGKAVWVGGCDGGYWLEFVNNENRFRVYNDFTGVLEFDADYYSNEEGCQSYITKQDNIIAVSIEQIIIKNDHGINCAFSPRLPAYGGQLWEIMKSEE